jgi:hypothetical protein
VFIGDFEFKFQGNLIKQYKEWKDACNGDVKKYEQTVKELMAKHYAFYGQFQKENKYVKSGSVLWCSEGSKLTAFDILHDHGVVQKDGTPIGICTDCKANENIYTFEGCKIPAPAGYPERPVVTVKSQPQATLHKCIPMLNGSWSKSKSSKIKIWDESTGKYADAVTIGDFLTCFYGGIIEIVEVPAVNGTKGEAYVILEQLDKFNFFMGSSEAERQNNIIELNRVLKAYGITTDLRISFFLGEVKHESSAGARILERFSSNSSEQYFNNKYSNRSDLGNKGGNDGELFRGSGYIQITGRYNYQRFADYVGDEQIMVQGYKLVGGDYNQPVQNIKPSDVGVIDIGKYAWEASGWFWNYGNQKMGDLNLYADHKDWHSVSSAINQNDTASFLTRNKKINEFYNILTDKCLGLPEK